MGRRNIREWIKTAVAMLTMCAILIVGIPYSLMQAVGLGSVPIKVYAANGDPGIVEGSGVLGNAVNTADAQTVYYAGTPWRVITYNNTGNRADGLAGSDRMTLLASSYLTNSEFNPESNEVNTYSNSTLHNTITAYYDSAEHFSAKEDSIMSINKNKITKELLEKAMQCETVEDLIAFAKTQGVEITKEEAEAYLDELSEMELEVGNLDNIAGGKKGKGGVKIK